MIEVNIVGQLGNQLFEYACARQLQEKYGGKICLNTYEMRQNTPNFRLALLDFNLNENVEVISERPLKEANADNYSVKILRKFFPDLYFNIMAKKGVFVWKSARIYKPLPLLNEKLQKRIVLNGYWQSEKYFSDVAEILRMELTPKKPVQPQNEELYNKIRNKVKDVSITTDIIVGFPGETESDFEETLDIVNTCKFDGAFTFIFSPRVGTPASKLPDNTTKEEKESRLHKLNELVNKYSNLSNQAILNKVVKCLVTSVSEKDSSKYMGYTENMKLVNIESDIDIIGKIVNVKITEAKSFSLNGVHVK